MMSVAIIRSSTPALLIRSSHICLWLSMEPSVTVECHGVSGSISDDCILPVQMKVDKLLAKEIY